MLASRTKLHDIEPVVLNNVEALQDESMRFSEGTRHMPVTIFSQHRCVSVNDCRPSDDIPSVSSY